MTAVAKVAEESGHNPIFDYFVKPDQPHDAQLQGLVAYALYKREKREWAAGLWLKKHQRPSQEQLAAFVETVTKPRLDGLSEQAKRIVDDYASAYVDAAEPFIKAEAIKGSFGKSVWQNIVASFLYSLFLIALVLVLKLVGIDVLGLMKSVGSN